MANTSESGSAVQAIPAAAGQIGAGSGAPAGQVSEGSALLTGSATGSDAPAGGNATNRRDGLDSANAKAGWRSQDRFFRAVAVGCGALILVVLGAVVLFLLLRAWPIFAGPQARTSAVFATLSGGKAQGFWQYVGPLVFGTVVIAALALAIAFFVALGVALFITFYARERIRTVLNYVIDLLAAIPSVIYGLWGALVLVPAMYPFWDWVSAHLGWIPLFAGPAANPPRTVASAAVILAIMIMPIITSMTRDVFVATPRLNQEAALALGATKWEMIKLTALPFARSGMVSASMLALGRALGETMAVMMVLSPGMTYSWHWLEASKSQTIAANIAAQYPEADSLGVSALIATGLVLFAITFAVNLLARRITKKGGAR
ncbi:phosphate ABC transporter permease subunit PstC [Bifidobacterium sp. ESL0798]|uniref:phosphate ABC transporter permease subunit PstC n=1 Tax=Bifidobacterium sp. ESL0798 TaxID=2983235 RepID=UPI0023F6D4A7|nr:phosphate ABC transporter permease subunit PstC [Bifidobacterium sp. ESL0798]WEV74350.1 phosphate ABC transporter permease subunit PstC [Bifidobacterium sp. ESL0798]